MKNGKFMKNKKETITQLKSEYGGVNVKLKLNGKDQNINGDITNYVEERFKNEIRDEHSVSIILSIFFIFTWLI